MAYRNVDCPHCGNEITVNSERETSKCCWCRRIVKVKFVGYGKKLKVKVEAADFSENENFNAKTKNYDKRKHYNQWKDGDTYGHHK